MALNESFCWVRSPGIENGGFGSTGFYVWRLALLMTLAGCGFVGPELKHVSGDLIHLQAYGPEDSSCGHGVLVYSVKAQEVCFKNGFKSTEMRYGLRSVNASCLDNLVEASFRCRD